MKALVLDGIGQPVVLRDVPTPQPKPGEILVRLHAAALNHRDVWIQKGQYAGLRFPIILGSDGAGKVEATGEGVAVDMQGQEVLINPGFNWGDNPKAQGRDFHILGLPLDGTFAEYVCVPAAHVYPKPTHLSMEQAAALPLGGVTAYRALFTRGGLQAGERVLVTGIGGGVALLAMQLALAAGAEVWVTSGTPEKLERAQQLGARGGISYRQEKWGVELAKQAGGGFDVIIDSAAGPGVAQLVEAATPGGRIVFYGGTAGTMTNVPPARVFWKQLSLLGSTMGTPDDFAALLAFVERTRLEPVIDSVMPLADGEKAMRRMESAAQFGKLILAIK
ncbi:zinc-binding dehydrogenase [Hymenobacter busanensis]|uniref:Zinc-binding dehydrogenase n=1 Tax=Hymenobacter busanensis TaxID=2607656 RepID=A0A7L5A306_9BACT|nr:zinc-binding dehydrogenase [Hymenobacter busanensis]KAA9338141.1 zinc-binding dehydrogenase [Hymenobacter busanensis]QHJ09435.1 zinc-binding dehydrogenase [Hymenobacter busanensis]